MKLIIRGLTAVAVCMLAIPFNALAQDSSIYAQCPEKTRLHPVLVTNPDGTTSALKDTDDGSTVKCQHIAAGDGMVSMAGDDNVGLDGKVVDGGTNQPKPLYVFGFADIKMPKKAIADGDIAGISEYPGYVMDQGMMAANAPAPTITVNEDDELFLSLTNVGMAMRPDLFDPHTIHWHGFPNASAVFDGLPESGISIAGGATLTYYYNAKDAGTYMYHCHVEATEHMQMGMLGSLFVRPRQDRLADGASLFDSFKTNYANADIGGTTPPPATNNGSTHTAGSHYAFNDGDGSTIYNQDIAIQLGSFDPDFHDLHLAVQPLPFAAMRDRYFLMNGRGYPDTVNPNSISTVDPLNKNHVSQPLSTLITGTPGEKILVRLSNLSVTAFYTVGTSGLSMNVVGLDARLLRDDDGNNMSYMTNSVTLGGGQSADVIIEIPQAALAGQTYFFYTKNLDLLANDAENFGGMMTEIKVVASN